MNPFGVDNVNSPHPPLTREGFVVKAPLIKGAPPRGLCPEGNKGGIEFEQRRADLDVVTRGRVDRLYAQLKNLYAKYGVSNIREAYDKMEKRNIKITKKDVELMDRLVTAIKAALEGDDSMEKDFKSLETHLLGLLPWMDNLFKEAEKNNNLGEDEAVEQIEGQLNLDKLSEQLLEDENFCQKILRVLAQDDSPGIERIKPKDRLDMMGTAMSIVYNHLLARLSEPKTIQVLDLDDIGPVGNLGFRMKAGHLIIHGTVGDNLGWEMKDGNITAQGKVGDGLGSGMEGGVIFAFSAGNSVGWFMKGGRVEILNQIRAVAGSFRGGEIWVAGQRVK